jgi:fibronectin-binding autotransporter adhesin
MLCSRRSRLRTWLMGASVILACSANGAPAQLVLTWDRNGSTSGTGGTGDWNASSAFWSNGVTFQSWDNAVYSDAVFAGSSGTVTLTIPVNANDLTFRVGGYLLTGGTLTLGGTAPTITADVAVTTVNSALAGSSGFTKGGVATLALGGNNTPFSGVVSVNAGTLRVNSANALGPSTAAANLVLNSGSTFSFGSNFVHDFTLTGGTVNAQGGIFAWLGSPVLTASSTLNLNGGGTQTLSGNLGDTGSNILSVSRTQSGVVILSGNNSYTGPTTITQGMLQLGSAGALSANSNLVFNGIAGSGGAIQLTSGSGNFTRALGGSAGQVQWSGDGGFRSSGSARIVNLGGVGATLTWGVGGFVPTGHRLLLGTSSNHMLDFQNGIDLGSEVRAVQADGGTLTGHARMNGVLSGAGGLDHVGDGLLELTGANNYLGGTVLTSGTLLVSTDTNLGASSGTVTFNGGVFQNRAAFTTGRNMTLVASSGTFRTDADLVATGSISGSGTLVKQGVARLILTGANSYGGGTAIDAGMLQLGNGGASGSIVGNVANSGVLAFNRSDIAIFNGIVSGTGRLEQQGIGTLILSGANSYAGGTAINGGTLRIASDGNLGAPVGGLGFAGGTLQTTADIMSNRTISLAGGGTILTDGGTTLILNGAIVGTGGLGKAGAGTLLLTGANSYGGGTAIDAGTLQLGNGGATGAIVGNVFNNGTLVLNRSDDLTLAGSIFGSGSVSQIGAGRTILTSDSVYSGGTAINAGTLQLGNGGTTGAIVGNVANNGALVLDRSGTLSLAGSISGAGRLEQRGTGTTNLSGTNSYTGATEVVAGTLLINGDQSAASGLTDVGPGAKLGGSGIVGGSVDVADGGTLAPGNSPGTLRINGDLVLAGGSALAFDLGQANIGGGPLNDLVNVGGNLVLDGTLDVVVAAGGGFDAGLYRVINYGGVLTDNGLVLGVMPADSVPFIQTSVASQVNLVNTAGLSLGFWDGTAGPKNNGVVDGGNGLWQSGAASDYWTDAAGAINAPYAGGAFAIFAGAPGTVTVDDTLGAITASGMQFASDGYTVAGGPVMLGGPQSTIRVGDGTAGGAAYTATITSSLNGVTQLVKTDLGTLVLGGANSYAGGTTINGGTLRIASDSNLGAPAGALGFDGGTLQTTADMASDRAITLVGGGAVLTDGGTTLLLNGGIAGTGGLGKAGAGTLILTGANSYSGGTAIDDGTLQLGNGGTTGAIVGNVVNNGMLVLDRSDDLLFEESISGSGSFEHRGTGTTVLSGTNSYAGGTILTSGTLSVSADNNLGTASGALTFSGGMLRSTRAFATERSFTIGAQGGVFQTDDDLVSTGSIGGSGVFTKSGEAALTLSGSSSGFAGTMRVQAGDLIVNGILGGTVEVLHDGRLRGVGTVGTTMVRSGGIISPDTVGPLNIAGNLVFASGSTLEISADQAGVESFIHVTQTAMLNGSVTATTAGAVLQPGRRFTILSADAGRIGRFTSLTTDAPPLLNMTLAYDINRVYLDIARNSTTLCSLAVTRNQCAVSTTEAGLGPDNPLVTAVVNLPDLPAIQAALDQLTGEIHSSIKTAQLESSSHIREALFARLTHSFGTKTPMSRGSLWISPFGSSGRRSSDANAARLTTSARGLLAGADVRVTDDIYLGAAIGHSATSFDVRERVSTASGDSMHLALYGGLRQGPFRLGLGAAAAWNDVRTSRSVSFTGFSDDVTADPQSRMMQVFGEAGYVLAISRLSFEPYVEMAHVTHRVDGFQEHGGPAALRVLGDTQRVTYTAAGLRVMQTFSGWTAPIVALRGGLGWRRVFGDFAPHSTQTIGTSASFTIAGVSLARNTLSINAGLITEIAGNLTFSAAYTGQISSGARDHGGRAELSWRF